MNKNTNYSKLFFCLLAAFAGTDGVALTTTPTVERFEPVANDATSLVTGQRIVGNSWGGNQSRIARSASGQISILYLRTDSTGVPQWRLMKRNDSTLTWMEVATGQSTDSVHLLRDPVRDTLAVIAWPGGFPFISTSPGFQQQAIIGDWQKDSAATITHYDGAGIGDDGTICLKANRGYYPPGVPPTLINDTHYTCGKYNGISYPWGNFNVVSTNYRYGYDYLFPSVITPQGKGLLSTAQRDLYKDAAGMPAITGLPYVYDGAKIMWSQPNASPAAINSKENVTPLPAPIGATVAPTRMVSDSFLDSKGRLFTAFKQSDPTQPEVLGLYLTVADSATGKTFFTANIGPQTYGFNRIYQDANGRLWLLWSNKGSQSTQMWLYPLVETGIGDTASFSLGTKYDLSKAFAPYAINGYPFLTVPRGGSAKANVIDGIMNACTVSYTPGVNYNGSNCYNADNSGKEKVFYFRISLPN